ncbi:MAG: CIA30 family protein [Pseudomonadota bacterium]
MRHDSGSLWVAIRIGAALVLLIGAVSLQAGMTEDSKDSGAALISFDLPGEGFRWITVNDNVMGGRSSGGPEFVDGKLVFAGVTNTRGGGFSSVRTREQPWELGSAKGLRVRVKGDGRVYRLDLRTDNRMGWRVVTYRAEFTTTAGQWIEVDLPFDQFSPSVFGQDMSGRTRALEPARIESLGFMIYDQKDGPFELEVDWIKAL